jgi:hypothetical protein
VVELYWKVTIGYNPIVTLVVVQLGGLELACAYEGALSFVTKICSFNRESLYRMIMGRRMTKFPRLSRPQTGESVVPFHTTYSV